MLFPSHYSTPTSFVSPAAKRGEAARAALKGAARQGGGGFVRADKKTAPQKFRLVLNYGWQCR